MNRIPRSNGGNKSQKRVLLNVRCIYTAVTGSRVPILLQQKGRDSIGHFALPTLRVLRMLY